MFRVNKNTKILEKVNETSFKDIECKERQDLQEWIVSNPAILGEELLIVQKEFAGFSETNERLDLLALDKQGNLVIIENKLDDTGKDVIWQSIKYASYCSTLTANQLVEIFSKYIQKYGLSVDSSEEICDFLGVDNIDDIVINKENSQRIIMVSRSFRAEVLSAVQWLINYGVSISCCRVIPYKSRDEIFLDAEQILPQKELQEYTLKLINKAKEAQYQEKSIAKVEELRISFWRQFGLFFSEKSKLFENITFDRKDHWIGTAAGMLGGISYNFLICKSYCGVEFSIANSNQDVNKKVYDFLLTKKEEIENSFGMSLIWNRLDDKCASRIFWKNTELSLYNTDSWDIIQSELSDKMIKLEAAMKKYASSVKRL